MRNTHTGRRALPNTHRQNYLGRKYISVKAGGDGVVGWRRVRRLLTAIVYMEWLEGLVSKKGNQPKKQLKFKRQFVKASTMAII